MYCSKCGTQIADDTPFCTSCGATTGQVPETAVATPAPKWKKYLPWIIGAFLLLLLLCAGLTGAALYFWGISEERAVDDIVSPPVYQPDVEVNEGVISLLGQSFADLSVELGGVKDIAHFEGSYVVTFNNSDLTFAFDLVWENEQLLDAPRADDRCIVILGQLSDLLINSNGDLNHRQMDTLFPGIPQLSYSDYMNGYEAFLATDEFELYLGPQDLSDYFRLTAPIWIFAPNSGRGPISSPIRNEESYQRYADVIAQYQEAIRYHFDMEKFVPGTFTNFDAMYEAYNGELLYYAFTDINADGNDEMLIGVLTPGRDPRLDMQKYDLFTWNGQRPVRVLSDIENQDVGYRISFYLYQDGLIATRGSSGADDQEFKFYRLADDGHTLSMILTIGYKNGEYFRSYPSSVTISETTFSENIRELTGQDPADMRDTVVFDWIAF
ncbi:MAG: zinc ribbon domain-containing protein [Coriobacteriia bacterium]|nr:zinc ribbon domain-containing protein [Coriobacteriia bacterium]